MKTPAHIKIAAVTLLLLSVSFSSFADNKNVENYPDGIRCIMDKYIAGFPKITKQREESHLWWSLRNLDYYGEEEPEEVRIIKSIKVKSIERFYLERESGVTENGTVSKATRFRTFSLEVWTLGTPADAQKLFNVLGESWVLISIEKPPKRYFVYENFFVLLKSPSVDSRHVIDNGVSEIIETCFECGAVDVGATLAYVGDKKGCGKLYRDRDPPAKQPKKSEQRRP